ncbi:MAG TPA: hypothetical protein VJR27_00245 [Candidatus Saccharimonadales bacterium]|nr:hypothetical protein [Candidatus Saccharimonadales bacterium]
MSELLHTPNKNILIASSSIDETAWMPVAKILGERGYDVTTYEADKVADGRVALDITIDQKSGMSVSYDGRPLRLDKISSAWYRRPTMFAGEQPDKARQLSLDTERKVIQYSLWDTVPELAWLSASERILHAEHKLTQLVTAREVGFQIPDTTVVTNSWNSIAESLPPKIIFKPSYGMLYGDNELKMIYTAPFDNNPSALPLNSVPFPGFWQPYLPKAKEWRITVVGDQAFDAAIYTDDTAKMIGESISLRQRFSSKMKLFPMIKRKNVLDIWVNLG